MCSDRAMRPPWAGRGRDRAAWPVARRRPCHGRRGVGAGSDDTTRPARPIRTRRHCCLPHATECCGDDPAPELGGKVQIGKIGQARPAPSRASPVEIDQDLRVSAILSLGRRVDIRAGQRCLSGPRGAIAAGPHLLQGSQTVPLHCALAAEGGRGPRTAIGLSADRRRAWIFVVDGCGQCRAGRAVPRTGRQRHDELRRQRLVDAGHRRRQGSGRVFAPSALCANRVIAARSSGLHAPRPPSARGYGRVSRYAHRFRIGPSCAQPSLVTSPQTRIVARPTDRSTSCPTTLPRPTSSSSGRAPPA